MREFYVILRDGAPYQKHSAIRTYLTRERAEIEARNLIGRGSYHAQRKYEVGVFAVKQLTEVNAE